MGGSDARSEVSTFPFKGRVTVQVAGELIADSRRAVALDEIGHHRVYYVPMRDVRADLLVPTGTITKCPHKGTARYWSIRAGGRLVEDALWAYEEPLPQVAAIAGHVAFYPQKVDAIVATEE
jgi:uncharacterized protein (DUF427 family)